MNTNTQQISAVTLTAGAGATTLATSIAAENISVSSDCVSVAASAAFENTSLIASATLTVKLQKRDDGGTYTDILTKTYTLRGALGLLVKDRAFPTFLAAAGYDGDDFGTVQARIIASCTGANVDVLDGALRIQYTDQDLT